VQQLIVRADAEIVGADQRDRLAAVLRDMARGELRERRRLAGAGRADQRDDTGEIARLFI
jgi:hypothetical protein